jgi:hypothetical protein
MSDTPAEDQRKPWVVPAITGALEPDDVANSYQIGQDLNVSAANDAS